VKVLRRVAPIVVVLALAAPAAANHNGHTSLDERIAQARARESALTNQIGSLTTQIRDLEQQAGDVSTRLGSLERDLALHQRRLDGINQLLRLQGEQLRFLKTQYRTATSRLSDRLVQIYEDGQPSTVEIVLGARTLNDALDRLDYANSIANQDAQIVSEVAKGRTRVRAARARTGTLRRSVAASTRVVAYRTEQVRALRDQLLSRRRSLAGTRANSQQALEQTKANEREWVDEANALRAASASVSSTITSQSSAPTSTPPSSSGLIWPVSGPITSPFGMRWGSLHPGIDIGVGMGTPIHAAASGRVIVAAYSGGYGNLIVIDHGNGLATAYAHQSSMAAGVGEQVAQGQVIGYVGSTGFSTGPHLHFEVRVNGSPVDPMGYL
jgi:murein DD-endopeptidase MepM/ murein hydrolase activator NlpD